MSNPHTDSENRSKLNALLPSYEKLKAERIRVEGDIERLEKDLAEAEAEALEIFGTTDLQEIEAKIAEARQQSSAAVEQFGDTIRAIQAEIAGLSQ